MSKYRNFHLKLTHFSSSSSSFLRENISGTRLILLKNHTHSLPQNPHFSTSGRYSFSVSSSFSSFSTLTCTSSSETATQSSTPPSASSPSPLNFRNSETAFQSKTTFELWRAFLIFKMCQFQPFMRNCETILDWSEKILGKNLTMFFVKHSFFAHFCAGENEEQVQKVMNRLRKSGIGGILDYAAESDVEPVQKQEKEGVIAAHTYDYSGEDECNKNMRIFLKSIDTVSRVPDSFAAIKITALGKPELLTKISKCLLNIRSVFIKMCEEESIRDRKLTLAQWKKGLSKLGIEYNDAESEKLFRKFDANQDGKIDYIEWTNNIRLEDMLSRGFFERSGYNKSKITRSVHFVLLDENETKLFDGMVERVTTVARAAARSQVRLMIDAEHTYMQPAIDHFVYQLQREHNRKFPAIFNTYQCYLTWSRQHLVNDMERAKREGFWFAGKLVRGAYMVLERKLALQEGRPSPIHATIEGTHENYNWCADYVLSKLHRSNLLVASQNQQSIELVTSRMKQYKIPSKNAGVFFGQLLGMSDHISFTLGAVSALFHVWLPPFLRGSSGFLLLDYQANYQVYKYVPYGPIDEVIPYLVRRIQENSDVMSNVGEEMVSFHSK
eukprot:Sdes_comp20194_c0_seq2m13477